MSFRSVFVALLISGGLIIGAFLVQRARTRIGTDQPNADFVKATGKCAECHSRQQYSIVHEFEMSKHAGKGVTCLDCHQPQKGQDKDRQDHNGFVITAKITPANCRSCHTRSTRSLSAAAMLLHPGRRFTAKLDLPPIKLISGKNCIPVT